MYRPHLPVRLRGAVVTAVVAAVVGSVLVPAQAAAAPAPAPVLAASRTLTPKGGCTMTRSFTWENRVASIAPHPRVVFQPGDRATIARAAADPETSAYHNRYMGWSRTAHSQPVPEYTTGKKNHLGSASVGRIVSLGYGLSATGDRSYSDRIRKEVAAIVKFPEWGDGHFLDTAELATAVSMGYSLTSRQMGKHERYRTRMALINKALRPASCLWREKHRQVVKPDNWGVVTNAAMIMAALVVSDQDKPLAAAVISKALQYENAALAELADGGTGEGPLYANYIGDYTSRLLSSMDRAFGSTGLAAVRGVPDYSSWTRSMTGPSGISANFGDSHPAIPRPLLGMWNGYRSGDRLGSWLGDQLLRANKANPLYLLWRNGNGTAPAAGPKAEVYPQSGLATLRSSETPGASWLAMKGGSNVPSHSQLELGSVIMEMSGQRFVSAYGYDNYSLPGYFNLRQRGDYFRNSTAAASTMSRPDENQTWTTKAPLHKAAPCSHGSHSVQADLSEALRVPSARRTATLLPDESIRLVDRVSPSSRTPLRWRVHTEASVSLASDGRRAVLSRGGEKVEVLLEDGTPGRLRTASPPSTPGGKSNAGFTILQLDTSADAGATHTVSVLFRPLG